MLNKTQGCVMGVLAGSVLKGIVTVLKFLTTLIAKLLIVFGLWIPLLYAAVGGVLYLAFQFNPFDLSLYSTLYLSGAVACVLCSLVISVKNIIVKPAKSVYEGYKHPVWEKNREQKIAIEKGDFVPEDKTENLEIRPKDETIAEILRRRRKEKKLAPPPIDEYDNKPKRERNAVGKKDLELYPESYLPKRQEEKVSAITGVTNFERPKIYFSVNEPDILVHEYSDRFELYRYENNRTTLDRVEYK